MKKRTISLRIEQSTIDLITKLQKMIEEETYIKPTKSAIMRTAIVQMYNNYSKKISLTNKSKTAKIKE